MAATMVVRVKLKTTLINELGDGELSATVSTGVFARTVASDRQPYAEGDDGLPGVGDMVGSLYRLDRLLGEGMFGSVYVAERTDVPEHRVAIKVINREVYGGRDVERELVMLAAAAHPNIVDLKDHGVTDKYVWLTMPLYAGETLSQRLERYPLSPQEAHEIFVPIARGVGVLHARGLRHQDIKPDNIYLADFGGQIHPVLLDLGVAVECNAAFVAGTALFASPEQMSALGGVGIEAELSEKIDSYCLASTLLFSLVGEEDYPGAGAVTPFDIASAFEQRRETPLAESTVPEVDGEPRQMLVEALQRWLSSEPDERPSADELADELDVLLEQERRDATATERRATQQKTSLLRVRIALGAAGLVLVGALLYGYSRWETLQLANTLEKVERDKEANFTELSGCNQAHAVTQQKADACEASWKRDSEEKQNFINILASKNESTESELNDTLATQKAALRTCEEDAERAAAACSEERRELETGFSEKEGAWEEARSKLEEEHASQVAAAKNLETKVSEIEQQRNACQQQLASCKAGPGDPYGPSTAAPAPTPTPYPD